MGHSVVGIMDVPDEIIIQIWKNLDKTAVIYSFVGVNKRFDKLVRDPTYTRCIRLIKANWTGIESCALSEQIIDRYCSDILPKIHRLIKCLIVEPCSMERILLSGNYPRLHRLTLTIINQDFALRYFTDESLLVKFFKDKIRYLIVTIDATEMKSLCTDLGENLLTRIFRTFENLTDLDFGPINVLNRPRMSIYQLSSMVCFSSSIVALRLTMNLFDDCLSLFDGRLHQLRSLWVKIDRIDIQKLAVDTLQASANMKCFSLTSYRPTTEYDSRILPLIRQMTRLEKLTLYISVCERSTFINGTHLENEILTHMPQLQTFTFNILTYTNSGSNDMCVQLNNDLRRTFLNWRYGQVDCYIDTQPGAKIQSHVYSLPYNMPDMHSISNSFPGGLFTSVRILFLSDSTRPFEHEFFLQISRAFPLLTQLTVLNNRVPNDTQSHTSHDNSNQTTSIVELPHLTSLTIHFQRVAYVEQFLIETNTRLPRLINLTVSYKNLAIVTENFTRDATRRNCSRVQTLNFTISTSTAHSKDFYLYFPCLKISY